MIKLTHLFYIIRKVSIATWEWACGFCAKFVAALWGITSKVTWLVEYRGMKFQFKWYSLLRMLSIVKIDQGAKIIFILFWFWDLKGKKSFIFSSYFFLKIVYTIQILWYYYDCFSWLSAASNLWLLIEVSFSLCNRLRCCDLCMTFLLSSFRVLQLSQVLTSLAMMVIRVLISLQATLLTDCLSRYIVHNCGFQLL